MSLSPTNELFSLRDKRVIVTGASSGIGRATALMVSELGARLLLLGRDEKRLAETVSLLTGSGHVWFSVDLAVSGNEEFTEKLFFEFKPTGVVHSAGVCHLEPIRFFKSSTFEETFSLNLKSLFQLVTIARKKKARTSEPFSFVTLSSVAARHGQPGISTYCASKGAVESAVRALAVELAGEQFRINAVAPGYVEGEMLEIHKRVMSEQTFNALEQNHPLGLGKPEDVAAVICFLLSDASRWCTGSVFAVDGGFSAK